MDKDENIVHTFEQLGIDPEQLPPFQDAEDFGRHLARQAETDKALWVKSDTGSAFMNNSVNNA